MGNENDTGFAQGEAILGIENTVLIMNHVYPQTRAAYMQTLARLQEVGYGIPDHAKIKAGEDEKDDLFFTLGDIGAAECGSCDSVISSRGVKVHNHPCECCGQPTCVTYRKDGAIRFRFIGADYYHQDGRAAFGREAFERMSHFVNHCVDVPFAEWQDFLSGLKGRIQKPQSLSGDFGAYVFNSVRGDFGASGRYQNISGPDFIYALAEWAGKMSDGRRKKVRDEPNIGNALEGVWKIINGQTLGAAEAAAMMEGAETPDMKAFGDSLKRSAAEKKKAARRAQQWRKNADNRNWGDTSSDPPDQAPEPDSP